MRSRPIQSVSGLQPISIQSPPAQTHDDKPECQDIGEDCLDSQNGEYDDSGSSKESMDEDAENADNTENADNADNAEDDVGDYGAQRSMETGYEFVESQPSVVSLTATSTGRSNIRIGFPRQPTPAPQVSRTHCTMHTDSLGDASPARSSITPNTCMPHPDCSTI